MKKTNFLKIALTLVLAFVMTGAFAQVWVDKTVANEGIDSVTVGATVPYYVEPDQYFNPATTAIGDTSDVALVSTFAWNITGVTGATLVWQSHNFDAAGNDGNSVKIRFGATNVAPGNITVTETATCTGTAAVTLPVRVIASPTIAYAATAAGIIGTSTTFCDGDAQQNDILRVNLTTSIGANPRYTLDYTYNVDTWNSGTSSWDVVSSVAHTGASAITAINTGTYDLNDHIGNFAIIAGSTTRYTYTLSGVTDRISRKSDYLINTGSLLANWTRYDLTPDVITVTVNPAPVTGPIYHISNMWAN